MGHLSRWPSARQSLLSTGPFTGAAQPRRVNAVALVDATAPAGAARRSGTVLARNIAILAGSQLFTWCATLLWTIVVPRTIGPQQTGVYTLAVAAGGVLTVAIGLGMRPLLVREIAADRNRAPDLIGTAIVLRALVAVPTLAAVIAIVFLGPFHGEEAVALLMGFGLCFFYVLYEPIQAGFQAVERMKYLAYADMLTKAGVTVGAIALALVGVRALGLLVVSVLHLIWARSIFSIRWRTTRVGLRSLAIDSLPYWSFAAFFTIYLWIDSLMLAVMTSDTVLGWYAAPTRLFTTLMFIPVILSTAWFPRLVTAARGGNLELVRAARAPLEVVLVLSLPVCAGTAIVAGPLVRALYGSGFSESVPVLVVLALCIPPMYVNIMVNPVLVAANRQIVWTRVMALASVLNPALNLVLIREFQASRGNGAIGAALALLLTELVIVAIGLSLIRGVVDAGFVVRLLKAVIATAVMAVAVLSARHLGLVAAVAVGLVTFPILAMALRVLSDDERVLLRNAMVSVRSRLLSRRAGA
jgi:O-antigen/teichoic acid export membrane protein